MKRRVRGVHGVLPLVLVVAFAGSCERGSGPDAQPSTASRSTELDAGALRASVIEGLEAAAEDPVLSDELGLAATLTRPELETASERMLARVSADPDLAAVADRLFADVQEGSAMRAALADYARDNPELDLRELTEGFVARVDERLTRPEIAETIAATLRTELRHADPALASALLTEAGAAGLLATAILVRFTNTKLRAELEAKLGKDPSALGGRLSERLADPRRVGYLLTPLGEQLRSEAGIAGLVTIVDHEQSATKVAAALARVLDDAEVRDRCESLFGLALAEDIDVREFQRELRATLDEPAVVREAMALLAAIARDPITREQVADAVAVIVAAPSFDDALLDALD